ncbi:phosphotransferase system, fructose-specific IIC component [Gottschalkia purinilytica]|uniref:Phosphotransferase system, fructose-specific IIC component n=1 Tax=Gottschalkia purinilytica TaxID=1503 RepID=A0A0L0WFE5_GOTPU|nr:PTS sugar transporter subunit IIC [Gottschalkia purinilytica]KNF10189.1 phosphotransferase system, fructose-specific IIC component [Gottschalkia purinilytica]
MFTIVKGISLLIFVLALFYIFSFKAPKGNKAMSGLANAAVATFLVEALHRYIGGNFIGIKFLGEVGISSGSLSGTAAASLVAISMGAGPVYALIAGAALLNLGILPGFVAGYIVGLIAPIFDKKIPHGVNVVLGAILIAPLSRFVALGVEPIVESTLLSIGEVIALASTQSPYIMGFLLGGIMKIICASPLSSMALTAMIQLKGLAMGISTIASFGGAFANGVAFKRLKLGNKGNIIGVMMEPLTQAHIITSHPLSVYSSSFLGGGFAGLIAAHFGIINNAPGTASPIPGLITPFAFNSPSKVLIVLPLAALAGILGGFIGSNIVKYIKNKK